MNETVSVISDDEYRKVERFIYKEARFADESRYDEWENLLEDDMIYWIPRGEGDFLPDRDVSILNDNRSRLATRINQLKTGTRHSQEPRSPMRKIISNLMIDRISENEYLAHVNFALFEMQVQSLDEMNIWAGRMEYKLRESEDDLKMFFKKVVLINGDHPVPTIAFII
ncbi:MULTISPECIES: aromatic-ring-hydroxylating dioxygenase subunit beta [Pseudomonadota]|uniref:aromatic-ring-hydroxylating dioxygenase subunit beta n=1 Tax=Pseudomonadota TaxID=1224 RepID=UPI000C45A7E8|nr:MULTISPECIES: aromatic-ring-hydroxylating dioxygenase subunit beta [Pseudomonadota]MAZ01781.1 hypothetical protein [Sneathiella sp.]CAH1387941.1 conserved hypothetical protein [Candidatus Nitrotoga sp. M5]